MNAPDQRLRNQILLILRRDAARTIEELAPLTGAPMAEVKRAVFALAGRHAVDLCQGYVALAGPQPATGRPS